MKRGASETEIQRDMIRKQDCVDRYDMKAFDEMYEDNEKQREKGGDRTMYARHEYKRQQTQEKEIKER